MNVSFWRDACDHFERVLDLPPTDRADYLRDLEPQLRRGVEALFAAEAEAGEFLETPALSHSMGEDLRVAAEGAECLRLGPYRLERELSNSGMSRVFFARRDDGEFEKQVAVKIIAHDAASDDLLDRFRRERQILASLDHPNIARLLDGGTTDEGLPYLVMELVEGTPIDEYCDASRLSIPERLELFRQVCSAVHYAHDAGVVHRDIKASNILVTGAGVPKLLDFGIAKLLQPEMTPADAGETLPGVRPMTPYYASPEQVAGSALTRATDVYSMGVLLFKLLAGNLPYRLNEPTVEEVRAAVVAQSARTLGEAVLELSDGRGFGGSGVAERVSQARRTTTASLQRELGGDLNNVVHMALSKKPERRYATARDLGEDLRRYMEGQPVVACGDAMGYRAGKFLIRNRARVGVTVALAWALIALALLTARSGRLLEEQEELAQQNAQTQEVLVFLEEMFQLPEAMASRGKRPRADQVLEAGARRAVHLLNEDPELGSRVLESIGEMYTDMGLENRAQQWVSSARSVQRNLSRDREVGAFGVSGQHQIDSVRGDALSVTAAGSCPDDVQFRVSGATPSGSVMILWATGEGSKVLGRGKCPKLDMGLEAPKLIAATITDSDGVGEVGRSLPPIACKRRYLVKAVDLASCQVSEMLEMNPGSGI